MVTQNHYFSLHLCLFAGYDWVFGHVGCCGNHLNKSGCSWECMQHVSVYCFMLIRLAGLVSATLHQLCPWTRLLASNILSGWELQLAFIISLKLMYLYSSQLLVRTVRLEFQHSLWTYIGGCKHHRAKQHHNIAHASLTNICWSCFALGRERTRLIISIERWVQTEQQCGFLR